MGYFRDDTPLIELILDDKGQKELNRLWDEFDFIADYTARTWVQYFFNQSGEVRGQGRASPAACGPPDKEVSTTRRDFRAARRLSRQGQSGPGNDPVAMEAIQRSLPARERHHPLGSSACARTPSPATWTRCSNSPRAPIAGRFRKPKRDDILAYYHSLRDEERVDPRRGDPRFDRQRADVAGLLLPPRSGGCPHATARAFAATSRVQPVAAKQRRRRRSRRALRLCARQPAQLLPLVQHARPGTAGSRRRRRSAQAGRPDRPGPPHAEGRARRAAWPPSSAATGSTSAASNSTTPSIASASRAFDNELREAMFEEPIRLHRGRHPEQPLRARPALRQLHVRESGAGEALRHAGSARAAMTTGFASTMPAVTSAAGCCRWRCS